MTSHIGQRRTVRREQSWIVGIGHNPCGVAGCKEETPEPADGVILDFKINGGGDYIWPFSDWEPRGWSRLIFENEHEVILCPRHTILVRSAVNL